MRKPPYDPSKWLDPVGKIAVKSTTTMDTHEHDYLKFLEPETLRSLEEWKAKR